MTNPNIDLPSQRKQGIDMNEISSACGHSVHGPSVNWLCKSYKPRKRDKSLLQTVFWVLVVILTVLVLNAVVEGFLPQKAQAKTIELRDCMTNKCICDQLNEGFGLYFDSYKPNSTNKDEILAGCAKETI